MTLNTLLDNTSIFGRSGLYYFYHSNLFIPLFVVITISKLAYWTQTSGILLKNASSNYDPQCVLYKLLN
jgi:hypothetical protein